MTTTDRATTPAQMAARIAAQIQSGDVDPYLKGLFDIIVGRKEVLGDSLPGQQRIDPTISVTQDDLPLADWERELLDAGLPPQAAPPPAATKTAHRAPRSTATATKPRQYRRKAAPEVWTTRPDPNMPSTEAHSIHPIKTAVTPDDHVLLDGFFYARADVIGSCIQVGSMYGIPDLRVKVVGVGPKAVKAIIVNPPPAGILHGSGTRKVDMYAAWLANTPVYFQHSILSPYLAHY